MADVTRRIGLSLGADLCWPICYEELVRQLDLALPVGDDIVRFAVERVTIEPFDLRQPCRYDLVVDRLTHWYTTSREWIKKAVVMDDLYVFNNPWSIQANEKHTSYCAMMALGLPIPDTWMVPPKEYAPRADLDETLDPLRADLRPRRGRRPTRLPDVHEALRRRRLGGRQPGRRRGRSARRLRGQRHLRDAPPEGRRSARPVRALPGVRAAVAHHPLRPDGGAARPLHGRRWRDQRRRTVAAQRHHAAHQQLLRLGLQLVRGAAPRTPSGTRSTSPTPAPTRR